MKNRLLAYLTVILPAAVFWVVDALVGSLFFVPGALVERLFLQIPPEAIFTRLLGLSGIVLISFFLTRSFMHQRDLREKLRKNEEGKTTLLDSLDEKVIYLDKDQHILWMNRAAREHASGLLPGDRLGQCHEFWPRHQEPCLPCPARRVFESGQPQTDVVTTPDGKIWSVSGFPILKEKGILSGVLEIFTEIARNKQMEEKHFLSEHRYRTLFETMPLGVVCQDPDGRFIATNPAAESILGLTLDQMEDLNTLEKFWKAVQENGAEFPVDGHPSTQALRTGKPIKYFLMGANGHLEDRRRWLFAIAVSQSLPNGDKSSQIFTIFHDLTEIREREEQIRKSEERFRSLIQNANDLIFALDGKGFTLSVSPAAQRILGFLPEELTGISFFSLLHPEDAPLFREVFFQKIRLPRAISSLPPYRFRRKDGAWVFLETLVNNLLTEPSVQGVVLNSRDVSDRKSMEEVLRKSERDKETILSGMSELLSFQDRELTVQWVNRATSETLGIPEKDLVGMKCYRMWPGQDDICQGCPMIKAIACGETCEGEVTTADGKTWYVRGNPVFGDDGRVSGVVELRLDITERKEQEEKIRYLTFHDTLTGLYNRLFFEAELSRLDTPRQLPMTVIIGDINGLKLVNDAFGHAEGDRLLLRISDILKQSCRREDILARWGGDEFIMLLSQTSTTIARNIVERIRESCRHSDHFPIPVSIALGTATKKTPEESIKKILMLAEDRMYKNKRTESRKTRKLIFKALEKTLRELTRESEAFVQPLLSITLALGRTLQLSQKEMEALELLVSFRNLGKIALPRETMEKTTPLTDNEQENLRNHPDIGYRIAQSMPELAPIAEEILSHHECYDGTGYPQGLKGEDIPLLSRIIKVCETYIKLRLGIYKEPPVSREDALAAIQQRSGLSFDPSIVDALSWTLAQGDFDPAGEKRERE
ncbi:MAG TPA: PAS domain S-box protein [Atribacteraceae bacterium]|nr:PAS domain S-box protein [Atribacteraceae bacterium]